MAHRRSGATGGRHWLSGSGGRGCSGGRACNTAVCKRTRGYLSVCNTAESLTRAATATETLAGIGSRQQLQRRCAARHAYAEPHARTLAPSCARPPAACIEADVTPRQGRGAERQCVCVELCRTKIPARSRVTRGTQQATVSLAPTAGSTLATAGGGGAMMKSGARERAGGRRRACK